MTRFSFTGPSRLTHRELQEAHTTVAFLEDPSEITTGAATGWDMAVALIALEVWPDILHRIVIPAAAHDAAGVRVFRIRAHGIDNEIIKMGESPDEPYRARNNRLIDFADALIAAVHSPDFYRSGEHMTVNIAKKRGVPVRLVDLGKVR